MTAKKHTPADQIASLQTALAGYKSQLSETNDELSALRQRHTETYNAGEKWRKRAVELEAEVGQLRGELHGMTVEKARLEGYIDRARENDPAPAPIMVPLDYLEQRRLQRDSMMYPGKSEPLPWYKRSI